MTTLRVNAIKHSSYDVQIKWCEAIIWVYACDNKYMVSDVTCKYILDFITLDCISEGDYSFKIVTNTLNPANRASCCTHTRYKAISLYEIL